MENEIRNENVNENEIGLVENENGDIMLGTLWFSQSKGVVEGTFDMFKFYNPSEKFIGYIQKALDLIQEGLYMEVYDEFEEEKMEQRKEFIEGELKDLEEMRKELEGQEEIENIDEGEIK